MDKNGCGFCIPERSERGNLHTDRAKNYTYNYTNQLTGYRREEL